MVPATAHRQDRQITKETLRLFWKATLVDKRGFIIWLFTRPPALFIYDVLIPFQVAYGLQAIITRQFDRVSDYAFTILILGLSYCALWAIGGVAICGNGRAGTEYVQTKVFANYLRKDYDFFSSAHVGTLSSQATKLKDAYNDYCLLVTNGITKQVIIVLASVSIIGYQSPMLALVTLACMALVLSFTIASGRWRLKYRRLVSQANSENAGVIGDALNHGTTVKSFAAEDYEEHRLTAPLKRLVQAQYWSWMSSIPADIGRILLASVATTLLLLLTGQLYEDNTIGIAVVILVQLYVIRLVLATHEVVDLVKAYDAIMTTAHQSVKTMLIKRSITDNPQPHKALSKDDLEISLNNVTYRYDDARSTVAAIKDLSLTIRRGEKVGLVGYSGSGKTTLTKLLLRFMDVTEGSITVGGVDIRAMSQKELRQCIAYVSQEPLLFHRSIADNISYGRPNATEAEIREAGRIAYVDEFVDEMPAGYDTMVGEKGIKLSGGQRQRVAIARALLKDAPILVLDEATSALDSRSEHYIQKALWELMKGRTAIVIAHRLSTIQRMDRIVVVDNGRIVDVDTHDNLIADDSGIYAKLWSQQSGGYLDGDSSHYETDNEDTDSAENPKPLATESR